jgi:hypothetical protein
MSDEAEYDLSGQWHGIFNYPSQLPPTEFQAELRDLAGLITGTTTEPHFAGGATIHAMIEGSYEASSIRFRKIYDDFDGDYETVLYEGRIDPSGDEISGRWDVPGAWSGTFLMMRAGRRGESVANRVTEKIEL